MRKILFPKNKTKELLKFQDIDECDRYGICSQGCVNTPGSYLCTCAKKFRLRSDKRTCILASGTDAMLLYASQHSIFGLMMATHHEFIVTDQIQRVVGIASDGKNIYWTDLDRHEEKIVRSREDGSHMETLLTAGLAFPEDIAIDWLTGNLYFSDRNISHIAVCSNDGKNCLSLISDDVDLPRSIVLYAHQGRMYWSDWGERPMIGTSRMDGTEVKPFVTDDMHWPNGIALDWPNDRLYWVDAKLARIESVKLDGTGRKLVLDKVSTHPYGLAVFENRLYWSDWNSMSLQTCEKFTCKDRRNVVVDRVIYGTISRVKFFPNSIQILVFFSDVHIYHSALYPLRGGSPCKGNECSHMCLLKSNVSFTCACPTGMELSIDQKTCKEHIKQQSILLAIGSIIMTIKHQSFGSHELSSAKSLEFNVDRMAYNSLNGNVFMADNGKKIIFSVNVTSTVTTILVSTGLENISAMAFG